MCLLSFFCLAHVSAAKKIVILGDSLSASYGVVSNKSWVTLLQSRLAKSKLDYQVINLSVSGDTTQNGLTKVSRVIELKPDVVLLELGGNDGLRGLPIKLIKNNLATIITLLRAKNIEILLIGVRMPPNYGPDYTEEFAAIYQSLAKKYKLELVPQILEGIAGKPGLMQADGIHPNEKAQEQVLNNVWEVLSKMLSLKSKKADLNNLTGRPPG